MAIAGFKSGKSKKSNKNLLTTSVSRLDNKIQIHKTHRISALKTNKPKKKTKRER